jgi:DNA uptake protein ComE-like DNA-binding protein
LLYEKKNPIWFWFSFIPLVGGLSIIYAGNKINRFSWVNTGIFITALGIVLFSTHLAGFVWLGQIAVAFLLKDEFIERVNNDVQLPQTTLNPSELLPKTTSKVDINSCSKDDLVHGLGLPIAYANEIESARKEGHIFTHLEELLDIAGIPDSYTAKLENLVIFNYYEKPEVDFSWRRCNTYSEAELIGCNLEPEVAAKIIQERETRGVYQSFPDLRKRTGLPLNKLTTLL